MKQGRDQQTWKTKRVKQLALLVEDDIITKAEVARMVGLSRERVCQILATGQQTPGQTKEQATL